MYYALLSGFATSATCCRRGGHVPAFFCHGLLRRPWMRGSVLSGTSRHGSRLRYFADAGGCAAAQRDLQVRRRLRGSATYTNDAPRGRARSSAELVTTQVNVAPPPKGDGRTAPPSRDGRRSRATPRATSARLLQQELWPSEEAESLAKRARKQLAEQESCARRRAQLRESPSASALPGQRRNPPRRTSKRCGASWQPGPLARPQFSGLEWPTPLRRPRPARHGGRRCSTTTSSCATPIPRPRTFSPPAPKASSASHSSSFFAERIELEGALAKRARRTGTIRARKT